MKVSIIGPGRVGMALAWTLAFKRAVGELVLVGSNPDRTRGEALDLTHAHPFLPRSLEVRAGSVAEVAGSEVVAVCASVKKTPEIRKRSDLAKGNTVLMRELLPRVAEAAPEAKLVMLSNPVDVLTWQALQLTNFPAERVIGMGTIVDSARFREVLSRELKIHTDDLRSYVLGEHGETQFPAMSISQAGGEPIDYTPKRREMFEETVEAGMEVMRLKGHTCYAVAAAAGAAIEAILCDEKRTLPLSVAIDGYCEVSGVCLSVPVVVGRSGVERVLEPPLSKEECEAFQNSAAAVRGVLEEVGAVEG